MAVGSKVAEGSIESWLALANSDPHELLRIATDKDGAPLPDLEAAQCRALAIAHRVLGDLYKAIDLALEGQRRAQEVGDQRTAALCGLSAAPVLAQLGKVSEAFDHLDRAEASLHGIDLAELRFQRGGVYGLIADYRMAKADYTKALRTFREQKRTIWQGDALMNRGLMSANLGEIKLATRDLQQAEQIFSDEGDAAGVAGAVHNLAFAYLVSGQPIRAVKGFEESNKLFAESGIPYETFLADHCEAVLAVGLITDAAHLLEMSIDALSSSGHSLEAAGQELMLAAIYAQQRRFSEARRLTQSATESFQAQGQEHRAQRAALTQVSIDLQAADEPKNAVDKATHLSGYFADVAQLPTWRLEADLTLARALQATGQHEESLQLLSQMSRRQMPFTQRVTHKRLLAEGHDQTGNAEAALRATRLGLGLVEHVRNEAPSSELHDALSQHLLAFQEIGVKCLLGAGRARSALLLSEQVARVRRLIDEPTEPSPLLVEYRSVTKAIDDAETSGREVREIKQRQRALLRAIQSEGLKSTKSAARADKSALPNSVTLRRYVTSDGNAVALDLKAGRVRSTELGSVSKIAMRVRELSFRLREAFANGESSPVDDLSSDLDALLGYPGELANGGPLLISFDSGIPQLPPGLLPSLHSTQWVLASSSNSTLPKKTRSRRVLISGPGLDHGPKEVRSLAARYPDATVLGGRAATVEQVSRAVDGAGVVHIAAHSSVNSEHPLFSAIQLFDGDFTLHALTGLKKPPNVVILASCESAASEAVGTTTAGLAHGLLRLGVGAVIGTALEIPDSLDTVEVMKRLHDEPAHDVAKAIQALRCDMSLSESQRLIARCLVGAI